MPLILPTAQNDRNGADAPWFWMPDVRKKMN